MPNKFGEVVGRIFSSFFKERCEYVIHQTSEQFKIEESLWKNNISHMSVRCNTGIMKIWRRWDKEPYKRYRLDQMSVKYTTTQFVVREFLINYKPEEVNLDELGKLITTMMIVGKDNLALYLDGDKSYTVYLDEDKVI